MKTVTSAHIRDIALNAILGGNDLAVTTALLAAYVAERAARHEEDPECKMLRLVSSEDKLHGVTIEDHCRDEYVMAYLAACPHATQETALECWEWPENLPSENVPMTLALRVASNLGTKEGSEAKALYAYHANA